MTAKATNSLTNVQVVRVTADTGDSAYIFNCGERKVAVGFLDVQKAKDHLWASLDRIGVQAITPAAKRQVLQLVSDAPLRPGIVAATRIGYGRTRAAGPLAYFAYGNGEIITSTGTSEHIALFRPDKRFGRIGDSGTYLTALAPILRDQSVPLLLFLMGLAPILQPFAKEAGHMVENAIVEVRGGTTLSKSRFMALVTGSVWGGDNDSKLGYAMSWNMTENRMEEICADNNNSLIILDETTLAGRTPALRSEAILQALHRISIGVEKGRMNQIADPRTFNVIVFSTSNEDFSSILQESPQVQQAAEVRLLSMPIPDRTTDLFDSVPSGFDNMREVLASLTSICTQHHGHLAPGFIQRVLQESESDHQKLIKSIRGKMDVFLAAADATSGTASRTAKPFALAYAAGVIAKGWGVLDSQEWGSFKRPLLRAYGLLRDQPVEPNAAVKLEAMLSDPNLEFIDSRGSRKPVLPDSAHQLTDGYLVSAKGQLVVGMTTEKLHQHLGGRALQELSAAGRIEPGDRPHSALVRVRRRSKTDAPVQDRLHLIRTPVAPAGVKSSS